jgi:hypothetical protein
MTATHDGWMWCLRVTLKSGRKIDFTRPTEKEIREIEATTNHPNGRRCCGFIVSKTEVFRFRGSNRD